VEWLFLIGGRVLLAEAVFSQVCYTSQQNHHHIPSFPTSQCYAFASSNIETPGITLTTRYYIHQLLIYASRYRASNGKLGYSVGSVGHRDPGFQGWRTSLHREVRIPHNLQELENCKLINGTGLPKLQSSITCTIRVMIKA